MTTPDGDDTFWALAAPLLEQAGVTRSTMMGYACLRLNGDFFACLDRQDGSLVVKLDETQVTALIEAGTADEFAPNGRRFREWASIPPTKQRNWPRHLDAALAASAARQTR